jgi:hypothetical protein
LQNQEVPSALEDQLDRRFQSAMSALQKADRDYWKPIIAELRILKAAGQLTATGQLV